MRCSSTGLWVLNLQRETARCSFASWRAAGSLFGLAESVGGATLQCSFSSPNDNGLVTLEPHALSLSHLTEISTARTFVHRIPSFPVCGQITPVFSSSSTLMFVQKIARQKVASTGRNYLCTWLLGQLGVGLLAAVNASRHTTYWEPGVIGHRVALPRGSTRSPRT